MRFVNAAKAYMQSNHGLTFEGFLSKCGVPNYPYIEREAINDICSRINLFFSPDEINQIVSGFDDDRKGKVKTSSLRLKLESG